MGNRGKRQEETRKYIADQETEHKRIRKDAEDAENDVCDETTHEIAEKITHERHCRDFGGGTNMFSIPRFPTVKK